jgi:hypothetical protein
MKPTLALTMIWLLFSVLAAPASSTGAGDSNRLSITSGPAEFSVDDFDWREVVPYLYIAAGLPAEQAIKALLENFNVLRAYIAMDLQAECRSGARSCETSTGDPGQWTEVSKRIDEIVQEEISRRHNIALVDYVLSRQPFAFTEISAFRTEKHRNAYLVLNFSGHSFTAAQLQKKYGAPYDTNVIEWYGVYTYKLDTKNYISKALFKIDPVDGAVVTVAISLKRKDGRK